MRKVLRGRLSTPQALLGDDAREAKAELSAYYRLPPLERSRRRPPLVTKIWSSNAVRKSLAELFLSKCAFCEMRLNELSDVSHFRPIGNAVGIQERKSDLESREHYSWFAYDWDNMFLSCTQCNRSKRNIFPVSGPRAQLRCTWLEAEASEISLLVNPCLMEPRKHLGFLLNGIAYGVSHIGGATVDVFSLNRSDLVEARTEKFRVCLKVIGRGQSDRINFNELREQLDDHSPFCGAARIALFELLSSAASSAGVAKPVFRNIVEDAFRIFGAVGSTQWEALCKEAQLDHWTERHYIESQSEVSPTYTRNLRTSQLRRLSIQNFKGISQLELDLSMGRPSDDGAPCMMLLGENSTGKSTTLQAVALALMGHKMRSRMGIEAEDFLPREVFGWQINDSLVPRITLEFDTGEVIELQVDPLKRVFLGDEFPCTVLFAFGSRRFFDKEVRRRQHASAFKSLFDPFAKLHHPGRWLQDLGDEDFNAVARAMREVLVLQNEDCIDRDESGRLFVRAHGRDSPLERLSDGYRSLMAMVLNVMRGMIEEWGNLEVARGIVLIDEIETHLHPRWKLRIVSALRRAMPNVQFIATTHDPLCLRGMRDGEVHVLVRDEEQRVQVLTGLPNVRGLRAEQLLTSDYFGLSSTADPEVEEALDHLALPPSARTPSSDDFEVLHALQWIGDTPGEQIVNEALRRLIQESASSSNIDRRQVRETAVNEVLNRLQSLQAGRQR